MAKGECGMLYLYTGGGGVAMIFSFDKSASLEGDQKKKHEMVKGGGGGGLKKNERKK